ncbi:F-box protein [Cardamine amara subsp. amara]|uniref:F-box protein n=1 Tax=Cardamine amara subsp. amara TaxID=228776 RepID=A0ABD1ANU7_CARAN
MASGLINLSVTLISKYVLPVICNPITGQCAILPNQIRGTGYSLLGFDPIDKQFKVLLKNFYNERVHHILTLETDKMEWSNIIQCPLTYTPFGEGICINGVLYYLANHFDEMSQYWSYVIVCFDLRYEKFKFIDIDCILLSQYGIKLINYKGKLGRVELKYDRITITFELYMWVLEDVEKQKWSKYVYTLPENEVVDYCNISVVGMTATGEIVLLERFITSKLFYVFYFNPERNTLQQLEIQGLGAELKDRDTVYTFVNHVEDLRMIASKQLKSSISAPSMKNKRGLNIIKERPKPQHREEVREKDRDRRYDDGKLRDHKHRERRNEGDKREDEDRRKKEETVKR